MTTYKEDIKESRKGVVSLRWKDFLCGSGSDALFIMQVDYPLIDSSGMSTDNINKFILSNPMGKYISSDVSCYYVTLLQAEWPNFRSIPRDSAVGGAVLMRSWLVSPKAYSKKNISTHKRIEGS